MLMFYNGYHFWGMHLFWWFIWMIILFWVFFSPYELPARLGRKDSPLDILKKRYVSGEISKEEFQEIRKVLKGEGSGEE